MPTLVRILLYGWLALFAIFTATGPWQFGSYVLGDVSVFAGAVLLTFAVAAISRDVRDFYASTLRRDVRLSNRVLGIALFGVTLFLLRVVWSRWFALEVNAWDLTINFDRPIESVLNGQLLYSEEFGMSMLGNHASWLSFAFVPLYAIHPTPAWLLTAHALAVAAGVAAVFALFRHETGDDFTAVLIAGAFLFNRYVAKATQYVYHPEIFYPVGLFLLYLAFLQRNRLRFVLALLLLVSIKEDAVIPIFGFALTATFIYRRWRWSAAALAFAALVFMFNYFYVLPRFSGSVPGDPWYATYWKSFGDTPFQALAGMIQQPATVADRVLSGPVDIFFSLALMPLIGFEWLLAALPGLLIYGSSDMGKLHWFTLYYAMPVLPPLFAAIAPAISRVARITRAVDQRYARRVCAVVVLMASVLVGAGHVIREPHSDRSRIGPLRSLASHVPATWVQGAIFPHVGYDRRFHVLNERAQVDGRSAFLLSSELDPYIYDRSYIQQLIDRLSRDHRYRRVKSGSLFLFVPVRSG
ncbi:MAG TPA: DUF2079 domain-containing protein [Thermoanaerobaculia bacterium]|nr:DUF2079 domain-containing protein [Thermoanaerobaculia bacterium]